MTECPYSVDVVRARFDDFLNLTANRENWEKFCTGVRGADEKSRKVKLLAFVFLIFLRFKISYLMVEKCNWTARLRKKKKSKKRMMDLELVVDYYFSNRNYNFLRKKTVFRTRA